MKVQLSAATVNFALMVAHVYWGAGYTWGPPRFTASGSYQVALAWLPATSWGLLFLAGAACTVAAPWLLRAGSAVLHVLAAAPLVAFALALLAAQVAGYSEGWGGLLTYLVAALFHGVLVRARYSPEAGRA